MINFKNRQTVSFAVTTKEHNVLPGAIHMEDMEVVVGLKNQFMDINTESPYYASMSLK